MKYIRFLMEFLFGCHHDSLSRVFTINRRTYCVCCDCGAEFDYSLERMSVLSHDMSPVWTLGSGRLKDAAHGA